MSGMTIAMTSEMRGELGGFRVEVTTRGRWVSLSSDGLTVPDGVSMPMAADEARALGEFLIAHAALAERRERLEVS